MPNMMVPASRFLLLCLLLFPWYSVQANVDCFQSHPKLESLTAPDWYNRNTIESKFNQERHSWWRLRQRFQAIPGQSTAIAGVLYTHSNATLKMTVFFAPLYPEESRTATLFVTARAAGPRDRDDPDSSSSSSSSSSSTFLRPESIAPPVQTCDIQEHTWHCTFRIDNLVTTQDYSYRVNYQPMSRLGSGSSGSSSSFSSSSSSSALTYSYYGMIPKQAVYPKIAALGCFGPDSTWQKNELVQAVLAQNPDLLLLQGDQAYGKDNLAYGLLELVYSIQDITRRMPTVVQLDDHDYGMGNLWGAGQSKDENSGAGFWESQKPVCIINALQELATSHLPDPVAKNKTLDNGMGILYTNYVYGNVDFAVLEARKFKNYAGGDSLLGSEQEEWLRGWCNSSNNNSNNSDENANAQARGRLKVVLAQTPFAALSTNVTNYYENRLQPVFGSTDTNAYPPSGRRRFMEIVRNCSPLVLSGDQHLGIAVTYEDYGVSECASPAAINDIFWRVNVKPVGGSYLDDFGHQYTLHQAWNLDEMFWNNASPPATRNYDNLQKRRRAEGFLIVALDGTTATCEMHSYRYSPELVWAVDVPAAAPVLSTVTRW